jgi:hypothetical protein
MDAGKFSGSSLTICCKMLSAPTDPPTTIIWAGFMILFE